MNQDFSFPQPICEQIWNQKYRFKTERDGFDSDTDVVDTWARIAHACANIPRLHNDQKQKAALEMQFFDALSGFKFLPAGRIQSGAGTERNVTLFNCFVMGTVPDDLGGIFDMLKEAALTMQQGGGIGYDFSTLRPEGAPVKGVESFASGPLTFMDVWDTMCKTIMSAGSRRGAMMATMRCDHPDIMKFIEAKRDPLRLRNFNVSVLCTDAFMEAVNEDEYWDLVFDGTVYETVRAAELWDSIIQNTYNYAEPGVIFIDRINKENNLWFAETIAATNPCGEQPLPPYGACLLGSINLAQFIKLPFTENAFLDNVALQKTVKAGVRLLDSVIDTSGFPLEAQRQEALHKRRMGLGVTGVADMLFMLGLKYGEANAINMMENIMAKIAIWAYEESILMAQEIGPAPVVETREARQKFCASGFMKRMPSHIRQGVMEHGIRNSHLLSIAPTGTISMFAGNVSSGIEPIFAPSYNRVVTRDSGEKETEVVSVYSVHLFNQLLDKAEKNEAKRLGNWWDNFMVTAQDLLPSHHNEMQAAAQKWVDSSISKTVNCPEDISFEDFKAVYMEAYNLGNKGCTTYRPNDVTGSVLSVVEEDKPEETKEEMPEITAPVIGPVVMDRPEVVDGSTYKLRWGKDAVYVTFNQVYDETMGCYTPFEIFVNSKNLEHQAATSALTRMISAVFRRGGDVSFVAEELKEVHDPKGGNWINGKYIPSLFALLGNALQEHLDLIGYFAPTQSETETNVEETINLVESTPDQCPECKEYALVKVSGCPTCQSCGYSKCG